MTWTFDPARYEGHESRVSAGVLLRCDAPHLLAEVLRLRAENERLQLELSGWRDWWGDQQRPAIVAKAMESKQS